MVGVIEVVSFVAGLALLLWGAELLVRGASRLAIALGVSTLVVGLTVVSLGTSAPELAIGVGSSLEGRPDIAIGNVIGSNIANVLLILGVSSLAAPLIVRSQLVRFDVPVMIGVSVLALLLSLDGELGLVDGALLVVALAAYLVALVRRSRRERPEVVAEFAEAYEVEASSSTVKNISFVAVGLVLLVVGSELLVDSSVAFAEALGLSELVIGLTLVAIGTSLPELATSIVAAVKGERDIVAGNVVGSNILNIVVVLGVSAMVVPDGIPIAPGVTDFDMPVMVAVAVACLPIFVNGHRIGRWEGAMFLGYYTAYTAYLILDAQGHDALEPFSTTMAYFVIPLTVVTLSVLAYRGIRRERADGLLSSDQTSNRR